MFDLDQQTTGGNFDLSTYIWLGLFGGIGLCVGALLSRKNPKHA